MFRVGNICIAAFLLAACASADAEPASELNFGIISTEASATQKQNWEPFLAAMSHATGIKMNGYYAADYAGIIEAMRLNKVQIAWYGNKAGMEAVDRADGEVFAQTIHNDGTAGYYSHLIVHTSSPIQTLDDVVKCDRSLDFGNGDPNSTSGFLVPMTYIFASQNIDPKTCFKSVRNAGHQANAIAVAQKEVHVATNNSEDLDRLSKTMPDLYKQLRIVWTSPQIPADPIVWRKDLDPLLKLKIYNFLMNYGRFGTAAENEAARTILARLLWAPFRPSSNNHLATVRMLEATKKLVAIKDDDKISASEKAKRVVEAISKISALGDERVKLANGPVQKWVDAFIAAEQAADKGVMKRIIEIFAANYSAKN